MAAQKVNSGEQNKNESKNGSSVKAQPGFLARLFGGSGGMATKAPSGPKLPSYAVPKPKVQGEVPYNFAELFLQARQLSSAVPGQAAPLREDLLRIFDDRLKAWGYNAEAKNFGGVRCLYPHRHDDDRSSNKCTAAFDASGRIVYLRCHASDAEGIAKLIAVASATTGQRKIAPLCAGCGARDIDLGRGQARAPFVFSALADADDQDDDADDGEDSKNGSDKGQVAGMADDLNKAWTFCKVCYKMGATLGGDDGIVAGHDGEAVSYFSDCLDGADDELQPENVGGALAVVGGAAFVILLTASGVAFVLSKKLLVDLEKKGIIPLCCKGESPRSGWVVLGPDELGPVKDSFVSIFGVQVGERLLAAMVARGVRYQKATLQAQAMGLQAKAAAGVSGVDDEDDPGLGGYRSMETDQKAPDPSVRKGRDEVLVYKYDESEEEDDELDGVGEVPGAAPARAPAAAPIAPKVPTAADDDAVVAYLGTVGTGEYEARELIRRARERGYLLATPNQTIREGTVFPPERLPDVRSFLVKTPVRPQDGSYAIGALRFWRPWGGEYASGVEGVETVDVVGGSDVADPTAPITTYASPDAANADQDTALDRKVTEVASAWGPITAKMDADVRARKALAPLAQRFMEFHNQVWQKGKATPADVNRTVTDVNVAADIAGNVGAWTDAVNPFAPSDDVKKKIEVDVAGKWKELEAKMAENPSVARALKPQHDFWIDFWTKWQSGDRDVDKVNAVISDVNVARANAMNIFTQQDKERVANVDSSKLTAARSAATAIDEAAPKTQASKEFFSPAKLVALGAGLAIAGWVALKVAFRGIFP